jgi:hypothetical protein
MRDDMIYTGDLWASDTTDRKRMRVHMCGMCVFVPVCVCVRAHLDGNLMTALQWPAGVVDAGDHRAVQGLSRHAHKHLQHVERGRVTGSKPRETSSGAGSFFGRTRVDACCETIGLARARSTVPWRARDVASRRHPLCLCSSRMNRK